MRSFVVGENIDLNSAGALTEIDMSPAGSNLIPFNSSFSAVAVFNVDIAPGTSFTLEGREDSTSSFTVIAEVVTADGVGAFYKNVKLQQEIRINVVGTAVGRGSIHLLQN